MSSKIVALSVSLLLEADTLDGLDTEGLDVSAVDMAALLSVDTDGWKAALPQFEAHLAQFGDKLPAELTTQLQRLAAAL